MADFNQIVAFTKGIAVHAVVFTNSDGTTAKQIFAPADPASRINFLAISSTAATQHYLLLQMNDGTNISPLGTITVPANAGTNGSVPIVSGLNRGNLPWMQVDSDGNPFMDLNHNMNLEIKILSALSSGETITIATSGGSYAA